MESGKAEYLKSYEIYKLTLEHYVNGEEKRINIEEPIVVQMAFFDMHYEPNPVCLNRMLDIMRDEMLKRARN